MNWNLVLDDQMGLTIAADTRFTRPDYADDQIWELRRVNSEPACMAIQTTFGLRATWARYFPIFSRREITLSDPALFFHPPSIRNCYPNYISLEFAPFPGLEVLAEYWASESHLLAGRFRIANQTVLTESFRFEWAGSLNPIGEGEKMSTAQMGTNLVLRGRSKGFFTVCMMSGNLQGQHSPFSSLSADVELFPGNFRLFNWAAATVPNPDEGLEMVRRNLAQAWDAEISRIELQNTSQILEITTGNPAWDRAFDAAQKAAYNLVLPGGEFLPNSSFVTNRNPDQGFSLRRDGSDYPHHWNGQTPLDALYLAGLLLPGGSEICRGLVDNFLSVQDGEGFIDLKPGLGGQRSRQLAQPVLATLAWQVAPYLEDGDSWLGKIFPGLIKFFELWFNPDIDRDRDGFPEWTHPLQSGLIDNPMVDVWTPGSKGVNILTLESPALAAFLHRECQSLVRIAKRTGKPDRLPWLVEKTASLKKAIGECWDDGKKQYRYRDYLHHNSPDGKELVSYTGPGKQRVRKSLTGVNRLSVLLTFEGDQTRPIRILVSGSDEIGTDLNEEANPRDIIRGHGRYFYTTRGLFSAVKTIEVKGCGENDSISLNTVDYGVRDISMLLPLWANAVEENNLKDFIEETILLQYMKPYGCPAFIMDEVMSTRDSANIPLPWNQLIGEGLAANGYRREAAELFTRLMDTVGGNFQVTGSFRDAFNSGDGAPGGERNTLNGLAPLGLFLNVLGIQRIMPGLVILEDVNPFPFPITVKYRGIKVTRHSSDTVISFPNGQTVTVSGEGTQQVTMD